MAQHTSLELEITEHTQAKPVRLSTAVAGIDVRAVLPVIVIKPVDDYMLAVRDLSKRFPGTVVVCEMFQEPHTVLAISVGNKLYPKDMIEILPE